MRQWMNWDNLESFNSVMYVFSYTSALIPIFIYTQMPAIHVFLICYFILFTLQLNPNVNAFHRNFVNEVKRCDEMERKLRFFEEQVTKEKGLSRVFNSVTLEAAGINSANVNVNELEVFSLVYFFYLSN
jgi:hypothetical protein